MWYNLSLDWLYLSPGYLYNLGVSTKLVTVPILIIINITKYKKLI